MEKSLLYCFFMTRNLARINYFAVMVTVMQFLQFFFYKSQIKYLTKVFTKEEKVLMTFLLPTFS